jgi:hypothetical protein
MQGLGRGLGTDVRLTELLAPYINEMLADRFDPTSSTANTTSAAGPGATCAAVNHFARRRSGQTVGGCRRVPQRAAVPGRCCASWLYAARCLTYRSGDRLGLPFLRLHSSNGNRVPRE